MQHTTHVESGSEFSDEERTRLSALRDLNIPTASEQDFDDLVALVKLTLGCGFALISIVDERRQWFKASCGFDRKETPREDSFCAHAVEARETLVVPDARLDPRFSANNLVLGPPFVRLYAGVPISIRASDGTDVIVGTLCIVDDAPRTLSADDLRVLTGFARLAESIFALRASERDACRLAAAERALAIGIDRQRRIFRQAERMANIGSWRLTLDDGRMEWSDHVFAIHEIGVASQPTWEDALRFYPEPARSEMAAAARRARTSGTGFDLETDFHTAKGGWRRVRIKAEVETVDGTPIALIGVLQDVTAHHLLEEQLRQDARIDELTGLPNRLALNEVLETSLRNLRDRGGRLALILIDLDHFKSVNDTFGHAAGDELLQAMAERMRAPSFKRCFVARLGGDEFVVVATADDDVRNLSRLTGLLLTTLRQTISADGRSVDVSATLGISYAGADIDNQRDLLRRADSALYIAKAHRRGSAHVYGDMSLVA